MELIDKSAVVVEIERRIKEYQATGDAYYIPAKRELKEILSFLDTIEVKEVKECSNYEQKYKEILARTKKEE